MEVKHRDIKEFFVRDERDILVSLVRGLKQAKKYLVYNGFVLDKPSYEEYAANKTGVFALDQDEWLTSLLFAENNPFDYALGDGSGLPAVAAYDSRQLVNKSDYYYETADGLSIANTCVRLVLWDK